MGIQSLDIMAGVIDGEQGVVSVARKIGWLDVSVLHANLAYISE